MIRSRKLLPCPDACPSYCYALMVECWAEQANRRPTFKEISDRLKVWKQSGSTNGTTLSNCTSHLYKNVLGAYFKSVPSSCQPTPQRLCMAGSKSSHTSDSQTLCPAVENQVNLPFCVTNRLRLCLAIIDVAVGGQRRTAHIETIIESIAWQSE